MRHFVAASLIMLSCCKSETSTTSGSAPVRRGSAPPGSSSHVASSSCAPAVLADPLAVKVFPSKAGALCLDAKTALFGEGAQPIEGICGVYDGECELYLGLGVDRVQQVRYVGSGGPAQTIDVNLSRFPARGQAYAMFTKRTVGDSDPAGADAPKPIDVAGVAALGQGNAYLWHDRWLAELTYNDRSPNATEAEVKQQGDALLPPLARAMASALEGDADQPPEVALLPTADRVPLGVRYVVDGALGVAKTGPAALGYHRTADGHRYRSLAIVAADGDKAKAILEHLAEGGADIPGVGDQAKSAKRAAGSLSIAWVFARKGGNVVGVGDESRVHVLGMSEADAAKLDLPQTDKVELLKKQLR